MVDSRITNGDTMKKSTKGAIATGAAAILLLGGASTLAFWNDDAAISGGTLASGSIELGTVTCGTWKHTEDDSTVVKIVPGDNVYKDCTTTLTLVGDHIGATLAIDPASIPTGALADELDASVVLTDAAGLAIPSNAITEEGTTNLRARITVDFDGPGGTNDSQDGTAVLDAIDLVATQTHN